MLSEAEAVNLLWAFLFRLHNSWATNVLRLIEKHGENYAAMTRDRKLNPMQQTAGDLRRRINKWKKTQE